MTNEQPYALFTGIPFVGHLNPLLYEASELARRGWRVSIASLEPARAYVEEHFPSVPFISLGEAPAQIETAERFLERVSAEKSWLKSIVMLMSPLEQIWPIMFDGLQRQVRHDRPDIMVVDFPATAGIDLAEAEGIPFIVNNADLLTVLPATLFPFAPGVPQLLSGHSIHFMGWKENLISRFNRSVGIMAARMIQDKKANKLRKSRGLPAIDNLMRLQGKTILVNGAFGLEYKRPIPNHVHLVGPVFPAELAELPEEWLNWLNEGKPVVYVNLGTLSSPPAAQLERMCRGFESDAFRVLWVMRPVVQARLPSNVPANVRIESWVPSPRALLAHKAVQVFVSHAGVNSVHEALDAKTPIVAIPMFAAQNDMGIRVQDAGVGILLDKNRFSGEELRNAIETLRTGSGFQRSIESVRGEFERAGGAAKAADLIEAELSKTLRVTV